MAVTTYCRVCQKDTSHASPNGCLECADRKEKEIEKEWMKLDREKKLLDLFRRVRRLEALERELYSG